MNEIWANRLVAGTKMWKDVPDSRKSAVKRELLSRVENGIITETDYQQITGAEYDG